MYRKINKLAKITLGEMWKRSKGVIGHFKKKLESVEVRHRNNSVVTKKLARCVNKSITVTGIGVNIRPTRSVPAKESTPKKSVRNRVDLSDA